MFSSYTLLQRVVKQKKQLLLPKKILFFNQTKLLKHSNVFIAFVASL